jgi:WD40 repeat protein
VLPRRFSLFSPRNAIAIATLLVIAGGAWLVVAPGMRQSALRARADARAQALTGHAREALVDDPELALLLAVEAVRTAPSPQAEDVLRSALRTRRVVALLHGDTAAVHHAQFAPDGKTIATVHTDDSVRLWDAESGKMLVKRTGHGGQVFTVAYSPDSKLIVTASEDKTARVWEVPSGQEVAILGGHGLGLTSAVFSPDGRYVLTVSRDTTARIRDTSSWETVARLDGHTGAVDSGAFSPDSRHVVTVGRDATTRVWETTSGKPLGVFEGTVAEVTTATFAPDGTRIVNAGVCESPTRCDPTVRVWDVAEGTVHTELHGHSAPVNTAVFSPDGRYVVSASDDESVRLWAVDSGQSLAHMRIDKGPAQRAIFSPDGSRIATMHRDRIAAIWIPPTSPLRTTGADEFLLLRGHTMGLSTIAFSADGRRLLTGSWDGTARVWDVTDRHDRVAHPPSVAALLAMAELAAGRGLTDEERQRFLSE